MNGNVFNRKQCGGTDASLLLSLSEMTRPENSDDDFAFLTAKAAVKIANMYRITVSDSLAVSRNQAGPDVCCRSGCSRHVLPRCTA